MTQQGNIDVPAGRYLQWKLTMPNGAPADVAVNGVTVAYVNRNVAPVIDSVNVQDPAVVYIYVDAHVGVSVNHVVQGRRWIRLSDLVAQGCGQCHRVPSFSAVARRHDGRLAFVCRDHRTHRVR